MGGGPAWGPGRGPGRQFLPASLPDSEYDAERGPKDLLEVLPAELPYDEALGIPTRPQTAHAISISTMTPTTPPMMPPSVAWLMPPDAGAGAT